MAAQEQCVGMRERKVSVGAVGSGREPRSNNGSHTLASFGQLTAVAADACLPGRATSVSGQVAEDLSAACVVTPHD